MTPQDALAAYPGLNRQPAPGEPGFQQLCDELTFAMAGCETEAQCQAVMVRLMVKRGFWPLGTRYVGSEPAFPRIQKVGHFPALCGA